jgi:hypothetical protein
MALYVNDGGTWKQPKTAYIKDGGTWKQLKALWVNNNGIWIQVAPTPGSQLFTSSGSFTVPSGVTQMRMTAIGGGAGAGNMVDGGYNNDYGGAGGGSSGQYVSNYTISVTPGETINVTIGAGGANAGTAWGSANQGGTGGTTYIYTAAGTYYLLGGIGGYGGPGDAGNLYNGGTQTTTNTSLTGVAVHQGGNATSGLGGYGGAGITGSNQPGQYYSEGGAYHTELNAVNYGGGGAAGYYGYLRQDQGKHPGWGGTGKAGAVYFSWGSSQTFTTVGTTSFTVPNFVTQITVTGVGGGGAGGGGRDTGCQDDKGGAGGGSSGVTVVGQTYSVTPGQVLSVYVGAGGTYVQGAAGNNGGASGITGIVNLPGGNGGGGGEMCSYLNDGVYYGGGASAGSGSVAGSSGYYWCNGGAGGSGAYGTGGAATAQTNGNNGTGYGAGGSGGSSGNMNGGGSCRGGNGAQGFIQINW